MADQIKTSDSDPIEINWIEIGTGWGQIGMTLCPGKKQTDGISGRWNRDLAKDLGDIKKWGAKHVLSLLEPNEYSELQIPDLAEEIQANGMNSYRLDTRDRGVPGDSDSRPWKDVARECLRNLALGESVLIHCKGGLGRTGTFVAGLLVENGVDPDMAIATIRKVRPGAIETPVQEQWITGLSSDKHRKQLTDDPVNIDAEQKENKPIVEIESYLLSSAKNRTGALFNGVPADYGIWSAKSELTKLDRFRGCLIGGAIGDALGAPVEFKSLKNIREEFGPDGIKNYSEYSGFKGAITDDTQMTMFTAEGCIRAFMRGIERGIGTPKTVIRNAYQRWLITQGQEPPPNPLGKHLRTGWLLNIENLRSSRGPGDTCLTALATGKPVVEMGKGCGGVMRAAPIGLLGATKSYYGSVYDLGCDSASITHGQPTGYIAAGAFAEIIFELTNGSSIEDSCNKALGHLADIPDADEVASSLESALQLAKENVAPEESIKRLSLVNPSQGGGWCAEEALAIGVYAALVGENFSDGIRIAVNHSGDSDSTGSIAGQILGATLGIQAIGMEWLNDLELRDELNMLAHDLYSLSNNKKGAQMPLSFRKKYPPN